MREWCDCCDNERATMRSDDNCLDLCKHCYRTCQNSEQHIPQEVR